MSLFVKFMSSFVKFMSLLVKLKGFWNKQWNILYNEELWLLAVARVIREILEGLNLTWVGEIENTHRTWWVNLLIDWPKILLRIAHAIGPNLWCYWRVCGRRYWYYSNGSMGNALLVDLTVLLKSCLMVAFCLISTESCSLWTFEYERQCLLRRILLFSDRFEVVLFIYIYHCNSEGKVFAKHENDNKHTV